MSIPYKPLSRSNSIRILNIEPTSSPSPLICTLKELDLHDGATYRAFTALSYRWGPPMPTRTITIDSHLVPIRQNLHDFLLLARDGARCHLWIDALCINQDDDVERAEQVKMMGTIYSLASRVLVWLGCLSFEEVHALNEIYDFVEKVPLIVDDDVLCKTTIRGLVKLLQNEYWTRKWILQELL
ncbi:heterokaryon incompatibility protein-domain-containing protein, partial [Hyaloscypha finlandica]